MDHQWLAVWARILVLWGEILNVPEIQELEADRERWSEFYNGDPPRRTLLQSDSTITVALLSQRGAVLNQSRLAHILAGNVDAGRHKARRVVDALEGYKLLEVKRPARKNKGDEYEIRASPFLMKLLESHFVPRLKVIVTEETGLEENAEDEAA